MKLVAKMAAFGAAAVMAPGAVVGAGPAVAVPATYNCKVDTGTAQSGAFNVALDLTFPTDILGIGMAKDTVLNGTADISAINNRSRTVTRRLPRRSGRCRALRTSR